MDFEVITLFPEMFESFLRGSLLGKAIKAGLVRVFFTDPRDFAADKRRTVDDAPYGGGPGMVMKPEPLVLAIEDVIAKRGNAWRVLLSPRGTPLSQTRIRELAELGRVVLVCGRYEGVDERVRQLAVDEELSLGDFVLSGGEVAALAIIDAVSRFIPGVLGEEESLAEESFAKGLLEYPQYTRPAEFRGLSVPEVLLSGHHEEVRKWRAELAARITRERRPELYARFVAENRGQFSEDDLAQPEAGHAPTGTSAETPRSEEPGKEARPASAENPRSEEPGKEARLASAENPRPAGTDRP